MNNLCTNCPAREICLQAYLEKRCPIPVPPREEKKDK